MKNKKKKIKSQHDIYISDETRENKIVIRGNDLFYRWIGNNAILIETSKK